MAVKRKMDKCYMENVYCPQIENLQEITPEQAAEYVRFVNQLRINQRAYFKTRNPGILDACKREEKELDALNARLLTPTPKLF